MGREKRVAPLPDVIAVNEKGAAGAMFPNRFTNSPSIHVDLPQWRAPRIRMRNTLGLFRRRIQTKLDSESSRALARTCSVGYITR